MFEVNGYQEVYNEDGSLAEKIPLHDLDTCRKIQIRIIYDSILNFVESKISKVERDQILALEARLSLNEFKNVPNSSEVVAYVDSWLKFTEDMSIMAHDLVQNVISSNNYDYICKQNPDFDDIFIPDKFHIAIMLKKLRGM